MLAVPASGQSFTASATVLETTSAEITNFSVVTGSPVDFLFTINNVGNTNISVFPEITVCDPDNNTVVQLIYNNEVNMAAGNLKNLELIWNTNNHGNFTAKLVVFYDNNSKSATASRTFVLPSSPAGRGSTGGYYTVTPKPIPASAATPPEAQVQISPRQPTPQQFQPIATAMVVAASQGLLPGILAGIPGFALPNGEGTVSSFWILIVGAVLLYGLRLKRYI